MAKLEISRFPSKERPCMPGSPTTQDRSGTRVVAPVRFAFRICNHVGVLDEKYFVAQWLACTLPCQRFAAHLTVCCACLGAGVVRYTFTVMDLHHLLLAGLPAHYINVR